MSSLSTIQNRAFAEAQGWQAVADVDHGISGAKERRPALDALMAAVRTHKAEVVACVKLDRLARSVRHLVMVAQEPEALGVHLVVHDEAIDTTTPSGRLLFHVLAAIAEFERELIRERVVAGVRHAKVLGRRLGRPRLHHVDSARARALLGQGLTLRAVARALHTHATTVKRALGRA